MKPFIVLLICLGISTKAQQTNAQPVSDDRFRALDDRIHMLERTNQDLQHDLKKLREEHNTLSTDIAYYKPLLDNWKFISGLFGIATVAAMCVVIYNYYFRLNKKVNEKVDEKITSLFTDRRADFLALLKEYDHEQKAKENHNIVMLTHTNGSDTYHYDLFVKHGFSIAPLTNITQLNQAAFSPNDCVIINNEAGHWTPEEVENFIEAYPNVCFYIGKGLIRTSVNASTRFAAATMRTQAVGNLMNLLKYHSNRN